MAGTLRQRHRDPSTYARDDRSGTLAIGRRRGPDLIADLVNLRLAHFVQ